MAGEGFMLVFPRAMPAETRLLFNRETAGGMKICTAWSLLEIAAKRSRLIP
jgi:hypothetical protein